MAIIEEFEKEAIRLLCADTIPNSILASVLNSPKSVHIKFTGREYLLEVSHPELSDSRLVLDSPGVEGQFQGQQFSFIVFIENRRLCLECSNHTGFGVPQEIRQGSFKVYAT